MKIFYQGGIVEKYTNRRRSSYVGWCCCWLILKFWPLSYHVRVYDACCMKSLLENCRLCVRDIATIETTSYLKWADTVIWLAALVGMGVWATPWNSQEINTNSVKWLTENFDGQIVFTSTVLSMATNRRVTEESPVNPLSVYAATKLEAEKYLKDALVFRLGTLFG